MTVEALPYVILLGFFFGTSLIASRFSVGQFEPITFIGLRLTLGRARICCRLMHCCAAGAGPGTAACGVTLWCSGFSAQLFL